MGDSKKSEHSGHRERLRRRFIDNGLDGFEEHQALELYLFYAIPRRDTNPLAHRLLERYRNIGGVCDAPIDELERDFGLSESAATLLKLMPEMSRLYNESKLSDTNLIDPETVGDMIARRFIGRTSEAVALLLGSAKGKILYFDIVAKGSVSSSDFPLRRIVDLAIRHNARTAYIAHNHPSGSLLPSRADIDVTKLLDSTLSSVGVHLLDHFIVADNEYASLREYDLI
ncbi:MAG: JAB domain-containing protein [Eubacteriales bacterium]|nr:JAB domain-containing protein [Eubacteriales bacterium]